MTKDEDADLEADPVLGSMRSVWRDMRDEEPPSAGLAELMAAARTKAAEMQPAEPESWWRRAFAMLVRPPMLAAATVVVLIGGAVVLNQRGGSTPTASTTSEGLREDSAPAKQRATGNDEDKEQEPTGEPAPPPVAAGSASVDGHAAPVVTPPAPPRRPAIVRETIQEPPRNARPDPVKTERPAVPDTLEGGDGKLEIAGEEDSPPATGRRASGVRKPATVDDRPAPAVEPTEAVLGGQTTSRPTVSTEQLIKQAETAASRKDCAAVRATVARIRKLDGTAYKTRVVTQPAIARCLD